MLYAVLASKEDSTGKSYLEHKSRAVTNNLRSRQLFGKWPPKIFEHLPIPKIKLKHERPKVMEREQ